AGHAHLRQMRPQDPEANDSGGDALFGDLNRGDIAGVAQDGRGAIADFADDGDRLVVADVGRVRGAELTGAEPLQPFELHPANREVNVAKFRTVEGARGALDSAFDL